MARKKVDEHENQLVEHITTFFDDPLGFVMFSFPWGEEGPLKDETGPDEWQTDTLNALSEEVKRNTGDPIQISVSSGHGVGKTALIAWIILWFMSTRVTPQSVVTANTKEQLTNKTWRELAKWHKYAINGHWFTWTATKFYKKSDPETWFASAVPWSKERSEAFAGTHEKHVLMIFDEASAIDDVIWEVTEGAMTTRGAIWITFGNPTRNTGRFRETFAGGRFARRWRWKRVDSRTAKKANQSKIQQWIDDYGEDSDFVRVRVKGEPPRQSSAQLISSEMVDKAMSRGVHPKDVYQFPIVMGVDVARFGSDQTVFIKRQGLRTWGRKPYREIDLMRCASLIAHELTNPDETERVEYVMIDATGLGAGVVDRLRQLGFGPQVIEVGFGTRANDDKRYTNKRTEIWCRMRDWIKDGGALDFNEEFKAELIGPEYSFDSRERLVLESKDDMKERGLESPDSADALACTFAEVVFKENDITRSKLMEKQLGANVKNAYMPRGTKGGSTVDYILSKFKRRG